MQLEIVEHEGRRYVYVQHSECICGGDGTEDLIDVSSAICLRCGAVSEHYRSMKHDKSCHPRPTRKKRKKK